MIHSYSSLADWLICPRLHKGKYIDKRFPFVETEATRRGNRLHTAMEKAMEAGEPPPPEWKGKPGLFELLQRHGARAEVKIGVTRDLRGCGFFDKDVWLRGKLDVYLPVPEKKAALLVDWKSGNPNYTDKLQAEVYAAMLYASVDLYGFLFIWGYFSGETPHERVVGSQALERVVTLMKRVEADKLHTPRPGWKCRFCPDTDCAYNQSGK